MTTPADLEASAHRARAARERLYQTSRELRGRLDPAQLAEEAIEAGRVRATSIAMDTVAAARDRPAAAAGIAAFLIALLARRRLPGLGRLFRRKGTDHGDASSISNSRLPKATKKGRRHGRD